MQRELYKDAVPLLKEAVEKSRGDGEMHFHYALALFADGKRTDAKAALSFAIKTKKYAPSHEFYLLMEVVDRREFRGWLEDMLTSDGKESTGPTRECAAETPAPRAGGPSGG